MSQRLESVLVHAKVSTHFKNHSRHPHLYSMITYFITRIRRLYGFMSKPPSICCLVSTARHPWPPPDVMFWARLLTKIVDWFFVIWHTLCKRQSTLKNCGWVVSFDFAHAIGLVAVVPRVFMLITSIICAKCVHHHNNSTGLSSKFTTPLNSYNMTLDRMALHMGHIDLNLHTR